MYTVNGDSPSMLNPIVFININFQFRFLDFISIIILYFELFKFPYHLYSVL